MFGTSILGIIVCLVAGVALLQDILLMFMFSPFRPKKPDKPLPGISILLAMRDEESNVDRCLDAVRMLDYPPDRMEILIGDDNSSDGTWKLLRRHADADERISLYRIDQQAGKARGKANVLAQLIQKANSDLFLITDADVAVNPSWAKNMTANLPGGVGLVNGLTGVRGNVFQHMEWLHAQGMMHVLQQFTTVTAIGNNMMVTRRAYEASGGFEKIDLSVTEDFALTRKVTGKGFRLQSRLSKGTSGVTLAERSFSELLSQRKRWMQGAIRLPIGIVLLLLTRAFYYPSVLGIFFLSPIWAAVLIVLKAVLQAGFIRRVNREAKLRIPWHGYLLFEIYQCIMIWLELISYLLPGRVIWKGREF